MAETVRPTPPDDLADEALLEWDRVCTALDAAGRLDAADRPLLVVYVHTWAIHHDMMRHVAKHGAIVKHHNGVAGQSPHYKTSREVAGMLRLLLADLGLTPLTRGKVKAPDKQTADQDEF